jgi:hypothetical protein
MTTPAMAPLKVIGGLEKLDRGISDKAALKKNKGYQA